MIVPASSFFFAASSSFCRRRSRVCRSRIAAARFWICDFSFCIEITMPVGMCVMRTAESVVFTDWPPGPEERKTSTLMSFSGMSTSWASSMTGITSTAANDVCRLSAEPNGLIRARRCVPASTERVP